MIAVRTIPDSECYNWIIVPATRCVQAVTDGMRLYGMLQRAVSAPGSQEAILNQVEALLRAMGGKDQSDKIPPSPESGLTKWSRELIDNDLHELHVPGAIALWASLEVAIEDTAVLILLNDPKAQIDASLAGVKLPSRLSVPLDESGARRIFARFEQVSRGTRNISQAYVHILETLGISTSVTPTVLNTVAELNYIRNCILHRGGVVDSRVNEEAPESGLVVGDILHIVQEDYFRYYRAVGSFAQEMLEGTIASRHARWKSPEL
jgi:hypothetical protein